GTGYPDRLSGTSIPLEARIVHLVDVYDALTSPRIYKVAWSAYDASAVIHEASGTMFDPQIVRAFKSLYQRGAFADGSLNGSSLDRPLAPMAGTSDSLAP